MPIRKSTHSTHPWKIFMDMPLIEITISEEISTKFSFQSHQIRVNIPLTN
jgi:hypothetical protein